MKRVADRLLIAGAGLIGAALGMALRKRGAVGEVVGRGRSAANRRVARRFSRRRTTPAASANRARGCAVRRYHGTGKGSFERSGNPNGLAQRANDATPSGHKH